jgi:DNA replication protein DnaC
LRPDKCRSERTLRAFQNRFEKYDLVIADEMGYISFDKEGAELLFTHLFLRAGRKSTIITTNLSFERWEELFQDLVMTAAMIDRLTHQAYLVNMNGNSYRLKQTKEWVDESNKISGIAGIYRPIIEGDLYNFNDQCRYIGTAYEE